MYKVNKNQKTSLNVRNSKEGESIEQKMDRIMNNGEKIQDGAPLIYTDRADGVQAGYNIRTDRWEVAVEGKDIVTKSELAKREARQKDRGGDSEPDASIGGAEPIQGTKNE